MDSRSLYWVKKVATYSLQDILDKMNQPFVISSGSSTCSQREQKIASKNWEVRKIGIPGVSRKGKVLGVRRGIVERKCSE